MAQPDELTAIVQRMIDAGESEENIATVIQHFQSQPAAVQGDPDLGMAGPMGQATLENLKGIGGYLRQNLPSVGGMVGGLMGGIPGAAAGGALGAGLHRADEVLLGGKPLPEPMDAAGEVLGQGALQGALEGGGQLIGGALRMLGRGAYRAGLLPLTQVTGKYGDVVKTGIENGIPASQGGLVKATNLRNVRKGAKDAAVAAAEAGGATTSTRTLLKDARSSGIDDYIAGQRRVGKADPTSGVASRFRSIKNEAGPSMKPTDVEKFKQTLDDSTGGAWKKVRMKEPLSGTEAEDIALSRAARAAQEANVPNYDALNKATFDAEGLRRAIARRMQGGAPNQGLENAVFGAAMAAGGGLPAAAGRAVMLPQVATQGGIALHSAGQAPEAYSNALRAALAALFGGQQE